MLQISEIYKSWFGVDALPPAFDRLVMLAEAHLRSEYPNIPPYEDMSDKCKLILLQAICEQLHYDLSVTNGNQVVTSISAGNVSESYSRPDVVSVTSHNATSLLSQCGFTYVGISNCKKTNSTNDCGC